MLTITKQVGQARVDLDAFQQLGIQLTGTHPFATAGGISAFFEHEIHISRHCEALMSWTVCGRQYPAGWPFWKLIAI